MKVLFVFAALIAVTLSHMCLLNPYQRGGLADNINNDGVNDCGLFASPCGGISPDERVRHIIVEDVSWIYVLFKNKDHFNETNVGNFTVNLLDNDYNLVAKLGSVPDTSDGNGTVYQVQATTPSGLVSGDSYVIQGIYYSNSFSGSTALTFYQCSDIVAAA